MLRRTLPLVVLGLQVVAGVAAIAAGRAPGPRTCDVSHLPAMHAAIMASCPCEAAVSRGQFTVCARRVVAEAVRSGTLPAACKRYGRRMISRSSCGRPTAVTCCRPHLPAAAACVVTRDAGSCIAGGGCPGKSSTCFDACPAACGSPSGAFIHDAVSLDALW